MGYCIECGAMVGADVEKCPICGAKQPTVEYVDLDGVPIRQIDPTSSTRNGNGSAGTNIQKQQDEVLRLLGRGDECFESGKAWLGMKDRVRARKEFQRAFKYYETVLKLDPNNEMACKGRAGCMSKMA